jgi:hypothetical protein
MKLLGKFPIKYNRYTDDILTDTSIGNRNVYVNKNGTEFVNGVMSSKKVELLRDIDGARFVDIRCKTIHGSMSGTQFLEMIKNKLHEKAQQD